MQAYFIQGSGKDMIEITLVTLVDNLPMTMHKDVPYWSFQNYLYTFDIISHGTFLVCLELKVIAIVLPQFLFFPKCAIPISSSGEEKLSNLLLMRCHRIHLLLLLALLKIYMCIYHVCIIYTHISPVCSRIRNILPLTQNVRYTQFPT